MKLELLVEEQTPEAVVEQLATGVLKFFPAITAIDVSTYSLPRQKIVTEKETIDAAMQQIGYMQKDTPWRKGEARTISPDGVDVMMVPSLSGHVNLMYYNLTQVLASHRNGKGTSDGLLLIGTHHRCFQVIAVADCTNVQEVWPSIAKNDGWNDGFWSDWHSGGVVNLAKTPKAGNMWAATHELGHAFGLEHPHDLADRDIACVMRVGISYAKKEKFLEFCDPCKETLARYTAK